MIAPPLWVDLLTAFLLVVGGLAALIGAFGLLRFRSFFQRVHTPTLGATVGVWSLSLATAIQISFQAGQPYVHALLIALFLAMTAPISTLWVMRAAVFRRRVEQARSEGPVEVVPPDA